MRRKLDKIYFIVIIALVLSHVVTMVFPPFMSNFDLLLIIYFLIYETIDEDNYIGLSLIFGIFADYYRGGFFGPAVMVFLLFSFSRFKADLVVDMTKFNSKVMLYALMSMIYCSFNLFLSGYDRDSLAVIAVFRTLLNVGAAVSIIRFIGYIRAVKNA
ncbi:MAG: rod shape-determining protein MreD [Deferribacterales bacterium]